VLILGRSSSRDEVIDDRRLGISIVGNVVQRALDHRGEVAGESRRAFRRVEHDLVDQRWIDGSEDLGNPLSDEVIPWARPHQPRSLPETSTT
jgi:hypothetical protein